jgi:hypothetical protein
MLIFFISKPFTLQGKNYANWEHGKYDPGAAPWGTNSPEWFILGICLRMVFYW